MNLLLFLLLPLFSLAKDPSFEILGTMAPSASAKGSYFTYSIRVKRADKGDIRELVKVWKAKGKFKTFEGDEIVQREGGYWGFPYTDRPGEGLLQILFFTEFDQPAGLYGFEGKLINEGKEIQLPVQWVEVSPR